MNYDDPNQVEEVLEKRLEATLTHAAASEPRDAIAGRGLPLGLWRHVLGLIKTIRRLTTARSACKLIGWRPCRDVSGRLMAYGLVAPFANILKIRRGRCAFLSADPLSLIANLHSQQPILHRSRATKHAAPHPGPLFRT